MDTNLTIQQVAEKTNLSVHTLRYYERNGLLEPINRASNGHRRYCEEDVKRIEFLTRLRATGMPIRQMQLFSQLVREQPEAIAKRRVLIEAHEQFVLQQIQDLQNNLELIQWKIRYYKMLEANPDQIYQRNNCLMAEQAFLDEQHQKQE